MSKVIKNAKKGRDNVADRIDAANERALSVTHATLYRLIANRMKEVGCERFILEASRDVQGNIEGHVVALYASTFIEAARHRAHEPYLVTGGFGCRPEALGTAVFVTGLVTGESMRVAYGDVAAFFFVTPSDGQMEPLKKSHDLMPRVPSALEFSYIDHGAGAVELHISGPDGFRHLIYTNATQLRPFAKRIESLADGLDEKRRALIREEEAKAARAKALRIEGLLERVAALIGDTDTKFAPAIRTSAIAILTDVNAMLDEVKTDTEGR